MRPIVSIANTRDEIAACLALRWEVFVVEQDVPPDEEQDGEDDRCVHFLATLEEISVGAARMQRVGDYMKIQRVCVPKAYRGRDIGGTLMRFMMQTITRTTDVTEIRLGAQTHALAFYQKLGFRAVGEAYLDAGIEHFDMVYDVAEQTLP